MLIWQHRHSPVYSVILNLSLYTITTQLHFKTNKQQHNKKNQTCIQATTPWQAPKKKENYQLSKGRLENQLLECSARAYKQVGLVWNTRCKLSLPDPRPLPRMMAHTENNNTMLSICLVHLQKVSKSTYSVLNHKDTPFPSESGDHCRTLKILSFRHCIASTWELVRNATCQVFSWTCPVRICIFTKSPDVTNMCIKVRVTWV